MKRITVSKLEYFNPGESSKGFDGFILGTTFTITNLPENQGAVVEGNLTIYTSRTYATERCAQFKIEPKKQMERILHFYGLNYLKRCVGTGQSIDLHLDLRSGNCMYDLPPNFFEPADQTINWPISIEFEPMGS